MTYSRQDKTEFARTLREKQTEVEKLLWFKIRNRKLGGYKFHRQAVIDKYIVDFVCYEKMLIIELDGGQHNEKKNIIKDRIRTEHLESRGYKIIRFWDNDVYNRTDLILEVIYSELISNKCPSP